MNFDPAEVVVPEGLRAREDPIRLVKVTESSQEIARVSFVRASAQEEREILGGSGFDGELNLQSRTWIETGTRISGEPGPSQRGRTSSRAKAPEKLFSITGERSNFRGRS